MCVFYERGDENEMSKWGCKGETESAKSEHHNGINKTKNNIMNNWNENNGNRKWRLNISK